jgi:hypothetical protein
MFVAVRSVSLKRIFLGYILKKITYTLSISGFPSETKLRYSQRPKCEERMTIASPLPTYLRQRYLGWKATKFAENKVWYKRLAEEGQNPRVMVISCCDSRVHVTAILGSDTGEFFIHRNVANLVPPFSPDSDHHGTSAAVEYAVTSLRV